MYKKYISISDLSDTIRNNFYKIPHDVDFVVGIPRSGMIVGSIVAELLNRPLVDIDSFCNGCDATGGGRLRHVSDLPKSGRVLVVDDTVWGGKTKCDAKMKLKARPEFEYVFMVAYLEGPAEPLVDIWLDDLREYTESFKYPVLYEWNIFHHNENVMEHAVFDMDGVLCVNPPDERDIMAYELYIRNAIPLFVPTTKIGAIVTYRLCGYRNTTEKWLSDNRISYGKLVMFGASSYQSRLDSGISPFEYKAFAYNDMPDMTLFVESSDYEASRINEISKKPVFCVESNKMYI